jgi:hypothetical protein
MRFLTIFILTSFISLQAWAEGPITVKKEPLDEAVLHAESISLETPLNVHLFDSSGAKLGKAKHQDTARLMAGSAPHLLAVDIVEGLRASDFSKVTLHETTYLEAELNPGELVLQGRFTKLNPGSQATRVWIGFGAGKSKVCIEGQLLDSQKKSLADFQDCRSGIGWGESSGEIEDSAQSIGDSIVKLLTEWAHGDYAKN